MNKHLSRYIALMLLFSFYFSISQAGDTVRVQQGLLAGINSSDGSVRIYKGIPYALPPIGNLRWRSPQPPENWKGVRKADNYGNSAMQNLTTQVRNPWTAEFISEQSVSEDCLYLNIWAPKYQKGKKFAVLVYIHGGGYTDGSGAISITNGENLAKKGIIVVGINYRLGIFGFFAHPELTFESIHKSSGNYGLQDQLAALKWVHQNIKNFGGDPERVTISGQSAGAGCVHDLIVSPLTKGLISGGIAESGVDLVPRKPMLTLQQAEKACADFAVESGLPTLKELRALSAQNLLTYTKRLPGILRPIIDGWVLPESVPAVYSKGKQNDVPILVGINADEGSSDSSYGKLTMEAFKKISKQKYGEMFVEFNRLYPFTTENETASVQIESERDYNLASMCLWADAHVKASNSHTYSYYFKHPIPWPQFPQYGAFHCAEMPYVFNNLDRLDRPWNADDRQLAAKMSSYWVNFVNTGNPNGEKLPTWPEVQYANKQMFYIDIKPESKEALSPDKEHFFSLFLNQKLTEFFSK